MVVVLLRVPDRLEARDPVAEVEPLHEPLVGEHVEHSVDARQPDRLAARAQLLVNLLRGDAAALAVEEEDYAHSGGSAPVAGGPQLRERSLRPGSFVHVFIVTGVENGYRLN